MTTVTKPCLFCGELVTKPKWEAKRHPNFFCNHSHAAKYNNHNRTRKPKPRQHKRLRCTVCGQYDCNHQGPCKGNWLRCKANISRLATFGFNVGCVGTTAVINEYNQFRDYIVELYRSYSQTQIAKIFNVPCASTISSLFHWLNVPVISKHEQGIRNITNQSKTCSITSSQYKYKHGYHITWFGEKVYYRSSYELDYCKLLDTKQVMYKMESLRIQYWDHSANKTRIAIPDFHLPDSNTIVEIKSKHTYDRQNMIDRSVQYLQLGFKFILVLDHKQYDYCP